MITTYGGIIGDNNASGTIQCNSNTNEADISISFPLYNDYCYIQDVGGIIGRAYNSCDINGNSNSGDINITDFSFVDHIGGIFGKGDDVNLCNSNKNDANIKITNISNEIRSVGGIGGYCDFMPKGNNQTIASCYSTGNITATSQTFKQEVNHIGGLFGGFFDYRDGSKIVGCHYIGNIEVTCASGGTIGGLIGLWDSDGDSMTNCFHEGNINLIGWDNQESNHNCYVGGLVGNCAIKKIENCYSKGDITGNGDVGGLFGYLGTSEDTEVNCTYALGNLKSNYGYACGIAAFVNKGSITNSYYIGELNTGVSAADPNIKIHDISDNSRATITNSKKLTKEEAKNQESFVGFDFEKIWQMGEESPKFKTSE